MEPLEIIAEASGRISPTFLNYQIGSEIEVILYHLLKKLGSTYRELFIISFQDAYHFVLSYVSSIYPGAGEVLRPHHLISINPFLEEALNPETIIKAKDAEIIAGRIHNRLSSMERPPGRRLFLILGLDLYGIRYPEELTQIVPLLSRTLTRDRDANVIVVFNMKAFPEHVVEVIDSFALNVFRFSVEVKRREIRRKFTVVRSPFLEYNLRSWYYTVRDDGLVFEPV